MMGMEPPITASTQRTRGRASADALTVGDFARAGAADERE
jgi:hypothetical protein